MKIVKTLMLLAILMILNLGQTLYSLKNVSSDDILHGTIWSHKINGEVTADYVFSKGLYVFTNYYYEKELPGKYRLKGNTVEMHDTLLDLMSEGKINGDKLTVTPVDDDGKPDGPSVVYIRER